MQTCTEEMTSAVAGGTADRPEAEGASGGQLVAGRFLLRSLLGRGGMGEVWLAEDELLGRPVALKRLLAADGTSAPPHRTARVAALAEARAAAKVQHDGVVHVHDVVKQDGHPWIVMELLPGRTLAETVRSDGPLPVRHAVGVGLRLLAALQAIHRAGMVHGDVKPGNVQLCPGGRVVLTDFGVAGPAGGGAEGPGYGFAGSPAYSAPIDPPGPFLRAGPLRPVLEGLLAREPGQRTTSEQARAALQTLRRGGTALAAQRCRT
jgi:hypothetical protein